MVFYRKYRPQLISELDLASVREKLISILSSQNIPHAFLFSGPKGLGKTSSARILAKAINCEKRVEGHKLQGRKKTTSHKLEATSQVEPCNICSACISITNGSAVDVLEIDAASNRGIDEIRDLRDRIKFSPSSLRKKIYIIDEVHMLTTEAFNALLKTLEEPPEHVIFILATTETGKLPDTILSRVFRITFEKPSKKEIARSLERIVKGEKIEIDTQVLEQIGELSDGAFRDGAKLLEELNLHAKGKITLETLEKLYKSGSLDQSVEKIIDKIKKKDVKGVLGVIEDLSNSQADFKTVIEKLADKLHVELIEEVSKNSPKIKDLENILGLLDEAYKGLKGAVLPQLPLEIAVIEYSIGGRALSVKGEDEKVPVIASGVKQSSTQEIAQINTFNERSPSLQDANSSQPEASKQQDFDIFKKLVEMVNSENKILAGLLRGSKLELTNGTVTLHPQSPFHLQKLSEKQNRDIIVRNLGRVVQGEIKLEFK